MNTLKKSLIALTVAVAALSGAAQAHGGERYGHEHRHGHHKGDCFICTVDKRQAKQKKRIREGVRSGEITQRELHRIREQRREVRWLERHFGEDGYYSRGERKRLVKELDKTSRMIARSKHNDAHRHSDRYAYHNDDSRYDRRW